MHLVFYDTLPWPYRIDSPFHQPVGGTQSALCYLMLALARRGHRVSLVNQAPRHEYGGVRGLSSSFPAADIADADAIVAVSDCYAQQMDAFIPAAPRAKRILWQHHAANQPVVQPLADTASLTAWDAIVFISEWQRAQYYQWFPHLSAMPYFLLRNAVSPAFENVFEGLPIVPCKAPQMQLAYCSTPFRGLDRLLYAWTKIHSDHRNAELQIFSSMKLYGDKDNGRYQEYLDIAQAMPGVVHVGAVPQSELAAALRRTMILAYPNTFEETACIAVMEAMAAGCLVITSDLGALPETLGGHGEIVPFVDDAVKHGEAFAAHVTQLLSSMPQSIQDGSLEERLMQQVQWINQSFTWDVRAVDWEAALGGFMAA